MNLSAAMINTNLKAAGLLQVAERAAKREGLRLVDVVALGPVTSGHQALWRALAREGKSAREIGTILGWSEETIAAALVDVPEAPKSRVRAKALPVAAPLVSTAAHKTLSAQIAALRNRLKRMARMGAHVRRLASDLRETRAAVSALQARLEAATGALGDCAAEAKLDQHLAQFGAAGSVVRDVVAQYGVPLREIFGNGAPGKPPAAVVRARVEITRRLTGPEFGWSQPMIGRLLRTNKSTAMRYQHLAGIEAAHPCNWRQGGKAAA